MVSKVNPAHPSSFKEGSIFTSCCQRLYNLASAVKRIVVRFFQLIFPCLFSSHKATPVVSPSRSVQPAPIRQELNERVLKIPQADGRLKQAQELQQPTARMEFSPYRLTIEFPEGPRTYSIENAEEEDRVIEQLEKQGKCMKIFEVYEVVPSLKEVLWH